MTQEMFGDLEFAKPAAKAVGQPWPRFLARMFDSLLLGAVLWFVLSLLAMLVAPAPSEKLFSVVDNRFVSNVFTFAIVLVPIACLVAFAETPGKLLLGVRVRRNDGSRLDLPTALKRELHVFVRGVGLGLPLVSMVMYVISHQRLMEEGTTHWDAALDCRVEHAPRTPFWWVRAVFAGLVVLAGFVASALMPALS